MLVVVTEEVDDESSKVLANLIAVRRGEFVEKLEQCLEVRAVVLDAGLHEFHLVLKHSTEVLALILLHVVRVVVSEVEGRCPEVTVLHALDDGRLGCTAYGTLS